MMAGDTKISDLGLPALDVEGPEPDDVQFWSVTTIIKAIGGNEGLLYWSAEEAGICAVDSERTWKAILADQGRDDAIKWLRDARFRRPKGKRSATQLGEDVHAACEQYALSGERPDVDDELRPFLDRFDEWLQRFQPEYRAAEVVVYHETYGYAGTADAFLAIDGVEFCVDYKTSAKTHDARGNLRKPYPESAALQIAAYAHSEFAAVWRARRMEKYRRRYYLLSPSERARAVPTPKVDMGLCIFITPQGCTAYPMRIDEPVFEAFLYAQEASRWVNEASKRVMGAPLEVNR